MEKSAEDHSLVLVRDADAVILDFYQHCPVEPPAPDLYASFVRRILDGVLQHAHTCLFKDVGIGGNTQSFLEIFRYFYGPVSAARYG